MNFDRREQIKRRVRVGGSKRTNIDERDPTFDDPDSCLFEVESDPESDPDVDRV